MENIALWRYRVDFGMGIFGESLVNKVGVFGEDFWGVFARDFCQPIRDLWWGFLPVDFWGFWGFCVYQYINMIT